jgi:TPR repeat protein
VNNLFDQASQAWDEGNDRKAFQLFREAVKQGDSYSILNLGYCYDEGIGTKKNKRKALFWYKQAAKNGDLSAYINIGIHYETIGNFNKAKTWYLNALKKGEDSSALNLAKLGIQNKINLTLDEIYEYLQIVIKSNWVCEIEEEEAYELLKQLDDF